MSESGSQPDPDALPHTRWSRRIDALLEALGSAGSWIWLVLLAVIVVNVVARYVFGEGRIEFEELQWHLYAVGLLVGIAVGVTTDTHVRVDFFRERLAEHQRMWVEFYGLLVLVLPFVLLVLLYSVPWVAHAYETGEVSAAPGGLPYRFLIKSALPLGFVLVGLAAFSRGLRVCAYLFGAPAPLAEED